MNDKDLTPEEAKARYEKFVEIMEANGFTNWAGPDHPIYSEGASTIFVGSSLSGIFTEPADEPLEEVEPSAVVTKIEPCEQNSLTRKIFKELKSEYLGYNHSLDADEVNSLIELDEDSENITWVSSTWIEPRAVNLHLCTVIGEPDNIFATAHWDRGVLVEVIGPWLSVDDAKASFGFVKEGWSDV